MGFWPFSRTHRTRPRARLHAPGLPPPPPPLSLSSASVLSAPPNERPNKQVQGVDAIACAPCSRRVFWFRLSGTSARPQHPHPVWSLSSLLFPPTPHTSFLFSSTPPLHSTHPPTTTRAADLARLHTGPHASTRNGSVLPACRGTLAATISPALCSTAQCPAPHRSHRPGLCTKG